MERNEPRRTLFRAKGRPVLRTITDEATVLTIDVERDWAGTDTRAIDIVLPRMVEVLARHEVRATFFVVAELIDEVAPYLVGTDHEVGSHGLTHRRLSRLTPHEQRHEITESKRRIEAAGFDVVGFRAPFLDTTEHTPAHLAAAGYAYDASAGRLVPGRRVEAPLAVASMRTGVPFTMTWLRMLGPRAVRLAPSTGVFLCHLHEFLSDVDGWESLPQPMRKLHARNAGAASWQMLHQLLDDPNRHWTTAAAAA